MLQHLGIGDPRVRHVGVDGARAVEARPGPGAAADRLVVAEALVAEEQVVHRPLAAGGEPERLEQGVDHPLAGLDVPPHHRRSLGGIVREGRIQHPGRDPDLDRPQDPLVERQRLGDQQAQDVEHGAADHGGRRVEVPRMDAGRAGEVDVTAGSRAGPAISIRTAIGGAVVQPLHGLVARRRAAGPGRRAAAPRPGP